MKKENVFRIKSDDMGPILCKNDEVIYKNTKFMNVKVNDLVFVRKNRSEFVHRVIYKGNNYVVTKGDRCVQSDGKLRHLDIIGVVIKASRGKYSFSIDSHYIFQSFIYLQEINKLFLRFEKENIDCVVLKGLPLNLYFEKQIPQRIYADCDILIEKEDMKTAGRIFSELGYRKSNTNSVTGREIKEKAEISFIKRVKGIDVCFDVHREIVFLMSRVGDVDKLYPRKLLNDLTRKFIREKKIINLYNRKYPILSNSNLVVYLFLHLFNHDFKGAYRYYFLEHILKSGHNYNEIKMVIQKFRLNNFIYPSILIFKMYFNKSRVSAVAKNYDIKSNKKKFINQITKEIDIFSDQSIGEGGHFKLLFRLSPNPLWKKIFVFFNMQVLYSILWVISKKVLKNG